LLQLRARFHSKQSTPLANARPAPAPSFTLGLAGSSQARLVVEKMSNGSKIEPSAIKQHRKQDSLSIGLDTFSFS